MHTTNLRKVGGSVMLTVPPAILDELQLKQGSTVEMAIERGKLVIEPKARPRYTLDELLAKCNPKARRSREDTAWLTGKRAGGELL